MLEGLSMTAGHGSTTIVVTRLFDAPERCLRSLDQDRTRCTLVGPERERTGTSVTP